MADTSLADWAVENADKLKLEATKVTWVDDWLPGFFDYQAKITVSGHTYFGRGIASTSVLAFTKAVAEALERAESAQLDEPWATAAHCTLAEAQANAYFELLGIDRAICHHYTGRRLRNLPLEAAGGNFPHNQLSEMLRRNGLELNMAEFRPAADAKIIGVFVNSARKSHVKGFIKGYGVSPDLKTSISNAIVECMRNVTAVFLGDIKPEEDELACTPYNPRWHFWRAQAKESLAYLKQVLLPLPGAEPDMQPEAISINDARFTEIKGLKSLSPDLPLFFAQARSPKLIRPQFGNFVPDEATIERLITFNGGPIDIKTDIPHFYG